MKKVFNTNELAHIWAAQKQDEGRNSGGNFYFEGATIYSYGRHFPIATIEGGDVFFTLRGYSNTTAKHIFKAKQAVSHKNFIHCYEVPVKWDENPLKKQPNAFTHSGNIERWKREIKALFEELGNKRNRDIQGRVSTINTHIQRLQTYCEYFNLKIKDKELKGFLKAAASPDFVAIARNESEKQTAARVKKMEQAAKAYDTYLEYWRNYKPTDELPDKVKELANFYQTQTESYTRLRFNTNKNRVETSKGVEIPAAIAKRAYIQLNGCMEGTCKDIAVPVMDYTITETGKDYIKAGCHTIPKEDVKYIANLLGW